MEKIYKVKTEFEQVSLFCNFAKSFMDDFGRFELREIAAIAMASGRECNFSPRIFDAVRDRYILEAGEQILRPAFFWKIGGDCDDQFIFYLALYLFLGYSPNQLFVVEARDEDSEFYSHIFLAVRDEADDMIYLDVLPSCTAADIGGLWYSRDCVRITPVSDYI